MFQAKGHPPALLPVAGLLLGITLSPLCPELGAEQ